MKKIILSLCVLFFFFNAKTQTCQGPTLLNEDFNSGIPNAWTVLNFDSCQLFFNMPLKGYTGAWQAYEHYGRKGVANADRYTSNCAANDYLITPQITLGSAPVCLSWLGSTMYTQYIESYQILISTTTPDSTGLKANPPLAFINNDVPAWTAHSVDLSVYAGQTVYIGFWNNATNQYAIYIDDIRVSEPVGLDAAVTSADFKDVVLASAQTVSGQLLNGGLTDITSFNLNWKVGSGPVNTMPVSSVTVTPSSFYNFTHNVSWTSSGNGTYIMRIWASNLNGATDMYHANDTLLKTIFVNNFPRKPLVEEFTQASCPPCAAYNPALDAIVQPDISSGTISSIKYHTVWPGVDPMNVFNKTEVAQRVLYYGIGAVPSVLVDGVMIDCGGNPGNASCFAQQNVDSAIIVPSIFSIGISEAKTSSVFTATVTLTAKTNIPFTSFTLYNVIIEDTIVYFSQPGTNGETEFNQVARKMLPDSTGQALSTMTNNQIMTYTYSYTPDTTICNMSQLHMVAFVSDDATGHVYQSEDGGYRASVGVHNLKREFLATVFPNPFRDVITIQFQRPIESYFVCTVYDIYGRQVFCKNLQSEIGKSNCKLDLSSLSSGSYLLFTEDLRSGIRNITKLIK